MTDDPKPPARKPRPHYHNQYKTPELEHHEPPGWKFGKPIPKAER